MVKTIGQLTWNKVRKLGCMSVLDYSYANGYNKHLISWVATVSCGGARSKLQSHIKNLMDLNNDSNNDSVMERLHNHHMIIYIYR